MREWKERAKEQKLASDGMHGTLAPSLAGRRGKVVKPPLWAKSITPH